MEGIVVGRMEKGNGGLELSSMSRGEERRRVGVQKSFQKVVRANMLFLSAESGPGGQGECSRGNGVVAPRIE